MRRWWRIVGFVLVTVLAPLAAGAETVLRVGILADYPPYQIWPRDGAPGGADLELLDAAAQRLGWTVLPVRYERFDELLADLRAGHLELATSLARTPEREAQFAFTAAYARIEQGLVVREDVTSATLGPDLAGRIVAVVRGYASADAVARLFPQARLMPVDSLADGLAAVLDRRADTFIEAQQPIVDTIERQRLNGLAIARTLLLGVGDLHMAGPRGSAEAIERLSVELAAIGAPLREAAVRRWSAAGDRIPRGAGFVPTEAERRLAAGQPPLRVAVAVRQAPFAFALPGGAPQGLAVELAEATLSRAGLRVAAWTPMEPAAALQALRQGGADLVVGLPESGVRSVPGASFVGPYIEHPLVLVGPRDAGIWALDQLAGRRVALPAALSPTTALQARHPAVDFVDCAAPPACADLVLEGRAEVLVTDVIAAALLLADGQRPQLQIVGAVPELRRERGFGIAPPQRALGPLVNRALRATADAELPRLKQRWLENPPPPEVARRTLLRALPWALGALVVLALLWHWHQRSLRAEVTRRRAAQQAAEQSAAAAARFVAFLAHEVRNSLHAVIAGAELLRSTRGTPPEIAESLRNSSRATLGLLNDLLDRERLGAGKFSLQLAATRLAPLVAAVVDEMQPAAGARGMSIAGPALPQAPVALQLDALRVQQVLRNLIANAIKHAGGGRIEVGARIDDDPQTPGRCRLTITVRDHGPGMDDAALARAFEPFAASEASPQAGGLGLSLSRDLAARMGGALSLARADGGGLVATLVLPAEPAPLVPGTPSGAALVVEDAEVYAMLVERALVQRGWSVTVAPSVAAAREALRRHRFDLVLSDLNLQDGQAGDVIDAAAAAGLPAGASVVVMSAEVDAPARAALAARGVHAVLTKSADVQLFLQQLLDDPALAAARAAR